MLRQLRRVGPFWALSVVAVMSTLTYFALSSIAGSGDGRGSSVARVAATPSPPANTGRTVGGMKVVGGKLSSRDGIKAPSKTMRAADRKPAAPSPARRSTLARTVGQLVITPVAGRVASAELLTRVRAGQVGGVILFGENIATPDQVRQLVDALQGAARAGGLPGLLVMTDQEGGTVKRFASAPPAMSAQAMAASHASLAQGAATGAALAERGVNVDLAPVADVPASSANFLGGRAFGRSPARVSQSACEFSSGLHHNGVASVLKHFPGLGKAAGNTDSQVIRIPAGARELTGDLQPYRQCANRPRTMVMLSNAAYSGLTGALPAVVSSHAYGLLRTEVGFTGPTISDSLNAAAVASIPNLAVEAAAAGLDLQLWTSEGGARQAYDALLRAARSGALPTARVRGAADRVHHLKQDLGLALARIRHHAVEPRHGRPHMSTVEQPQPPPSTARPAPALTCDTDNHLVRGADPAAAGRRATASFAPTSSTRARSCSRP